MNEAEPRNDTTLVISGGTVVCEDALLPDHDVFVRNGRIAVIRPSARFAEAGRSSEDENLEVIDARGAYVAPGMIDVHSDYIEGVASPRPTAVMNLRAALLHADRELVAHGVTTMYHSLSMHGTREFNRKPIRSHENVSRLIGEIVALRANEGITHLMRHRLHLRIELDAVERFEEIKAYIENGSADMVSFMDHTPGQGQFADPAKYGEMLQGYQEMSDAEAMRIVSSLQAHDKLAFFQMEELARIAHSRGLAVSSHDDDSAEKLDCMEALGTVISEFPITLDVALDARARGMHTLAGAPNVVMGRSHSGNLSAREAICAGAIDMLCSDYYPAALLEAVFVLHRVCGIDLAKAFALVTVNPARAAGVGGEIGSIAPGKRADLIVVRELPAAEPMPGTVGAVRAIGAELRIAAGADADPAGPPPAAEGVPNGAAQAPIPVVTRTFVGGRCVYRSRYPMFGEEGWRSGEGAAADRASAARDAAFAEHEQAAAEKAQVA